MDFKNNEVLMLVVAFLLGYCMNQSVPLIDGHANSPHTRSVSSLYFGTDTHDGITVTPAVAAGGGRVL